jgi:hypothetical protein
MIKRSTSYAKSSTPTPNLPRLAQSSKAYTLRWVNKKKPSKSEKMISLSGGPELAAAIEQEFARSGYRGVVQSSLKGLTEMAKHEYVSPYSIAQAYMRAGDEEKTLEWLEKAHDEHASGLVSVAADPMFDPVRSNPRFQEILRQMRFTQ